ALTLRSSPSPASKRGRGALHLLADPEDAGDPADLAHVEASRRVARVERTELELLRGLAQQLLGHDLALARPDHHAIAAAAIGGGRDDDHIAAAIDRHHAVAGDLQGIARGIVQIRKIDILPTAPDGIARVVEIAGRTGLGIADEGKAPLWSGAATGH